jgi:WD40 repeat protein
VRALNGHRSPVRGGAFSPDGKWAVTVDSDHTVRLWDLEAAGDESSRVVRVPDFQLHAVVFAANGSQVIVAGDRGLVACDLAGQVVTRCRLPGPVHDLAVSSDGKHLATANANGTAYILRLPLGAR